MLPLQERRSLAKVKMEQVRIDKDCNEMSEYMVDKDVELRGPGIA
jgi:hypothetical protein